MRKIWFKQQERFNYMPLRAGLGYITASELKQYWQDVFTGHDEVEDHPELCPKIYTTRLHPLSGEYYVVEGSRYKAKPVEPRIEFKVDYPVTMELNLLTELIHYDGTWASGEIHASALASSLYRDHLTFPELDLGYRGATFEQLRDELLILNPKADLGTPFFVNRLERL